MWVEPITLTGHKIRLEPLSMKHSRDLWQASTAEPGLLKYSVLYPENDTFESFEEYMRRTLDMPGRVPFAMVLQETGQAIGTSSYFDIREPHRGLEIGYTWIGRPYQGTEVNPEAKYIMLRHAFEDLGAIRVQLKTDGRNTQSQRAMEKLGAKREGILRSQMVLPDGHIRDTVMYSIIAEEWAGVKARLEERLGYVPWVAA